MPTNEAAKRLRDLRERNGWTQADAGIKYGISQEYAGALERGESPITPEMYLKIAQGTIGEDREFFLGQAGSSVLGLLRLAEEINQERGITPPQGEVTRVHLSRFTSDGRQEATGHMYPVCSRSLPNPLTSLAVQIDSAVANPVLSVGDVIVYDTTPLPGAPLTPYWNRVILVDAGHRRWPSKVPGESHVMGFGIPGLAVGQLRCRAANGHGQLGPLMRLAINAVLDVFNDSDVEHGMEEIVLGQSLRPVGSLGSGPGVWESFLERAIEQAQAEISLDKSCKIIGRVVAWFPAHEDMPPIIKPALKPMSRQSFKALADRFVKK